MVKTNGLAIASLILGILGILEGSTLFWVPFLNFVPFLWHVLAIVFGALALKAIKEKPEELTGKGLAIAGLVLGILGLIPTIIFLAACYLCAAGGAMLAL